MDLSGLIDELGERGVFLWPEGDRIRFRGPREGMSAQQRDLLREARTEVLGILRRRAADKSQTFEPSPYQLEVIERGAATVLPHRLALVFERGFDASAMSHALQAVVDRHELLRARLEGTGESCRWQIDGWRAATVAEVVVPDTEAASVLQRVSRDPAARLSPVDGQTWRLTTYRLPTAAAVLVFEVHALAAGAGAFARLVDELRSFYSEAAGRGERLPDRISLTYSSWLAGQPGLARRRAPARLREATARGALPEGVAVVGGRFELDADLRTRLLAVSAASRFSVDVLMLTAWRSVCADTVDESSSFGCTLAAAPAARGVIGPVDQVALLPPTFAGGPLARLTATQAALLSDRPYDPLLRWPDHWFEYRSVDPTLEPVQSFIDGSDGVTELGFGGLSARRVPIDDSADPVRLRLVVTARKESLSLHWRVRSAAGAARDVEGMQRAFHLGLTRILDEVEATSVADRRRAGPQPIAHSQHHWWLLKQLDTENSALHVPMTLRVDGPIDRTALGRAFAQLVARHESLRTRVVAIDDAPYLIVEADAPLEVEVFDVCDLPAADRSAASTQIAREFVDRPFDASVAPLIRVALVQEAPERHLLCLVMDHLISDGVSLSVLLDELFRLYGEYRGGAAANLSPPTAQFVDCILADRRADRAGALGDSLRYWRHKLANLPGSLELPTDRPRPALQSYHGSRLTWTFDPAIADGVRRFARTQGVTPFMVLLSAFQIVLGRYCGTTDVPVGTAVANRDTAELQGVVGWLSNVIVLRGDLSGDPTVTELVDRNRVLCADGFANQAVPFDTLVETILPDRRRDLPPLFQVLFVLQSVTPRLEMPGAQCERLDIGTRNSRYDLTLDVFDSKDGLHAMIEYNVDLFDASTIERLSGHLQQVLTGMAENPRAPVRSLTLLSPAESRRMLLDWNSTQADYPRESTIHDLFAGQLRVAPDALAVMFESGEYSYRQLNARANHFAHRLIGLGAGPGVMVGILLERSLDMMAAVYGVLKSGAAYVPLDPSFPKDRIDYMQQDANLQIVITDRVLHATMGVVASGVVFVEEAGLRDDDPPRRAAACDLAYVIYTSGSTGRPKGVMLEHRSVVNFLRSMQAVPGIRRGDRFVSVTTLSFDIAGLEIHGPLTIGGTVVLASRPTAVNGTSLGRLVDDTGAQLLQATPTTWRVLIEAGWTARPGLKMLCGGEPLPRDVADRLVAMGGELWNLYGPTETTIWSTAERIVDAALPITIGRPIANTQVYVLDAAGLPTPPLVAGELYIGGDGLARGYLGREDLTAEKFVTLDLPAVGRARAYRTGDMVRWLADGRVEFQGRRDHQVKIRGHRIELGEIEGQLGSHPDVARCVVSAREDSPGDIRLAAYVVCAEGRTLTPSDMRDHLRQRLPDFMIPQYFMTLDEIPLTPNGKIDRKQLPKPIVLAESQERTYEAPQTPAERAIADVWEEMLSIDRVGLSDNFYDLGGHSLLVVRAVAETERRFGLRTTALDYLSGSLRRLAGNAVAIDPSPSAKQPEKGRLRSLIATLRQRVS